MSADRIAPPSRGKGDRVTCGNNGCECERNVDHIADRRNQRKWPRRSSRLRRLAEKCLPTSSMMDRAGIEATGRGGSHLPFQLKTFRLTFVLSKTDCQRSTKSAEDPLKCPSMAGFQMSTEGDVSSLPLSIRRRYGRPRSAIIGSGTRVTRGLAKLVSTSSASHSRVKVSTTPSTRTARPLANRSCTKCNDHSSFGAVG